LAESNLRNANLRNTLLIAADLRGADLSKADLRDAVLSEADLSGALLSEAIGVTNEGLEKDAKSLEGATMPNSQKYEDWLKDGERHKEDGENDGSS
jgi:uncharacterized protein YjbI with pentapeptide repeats